MGTNYNAHLNHCDCCGRYDDLHVGKSFRTVRGHPEDSIGAGLIGRTIDSFADWREVIEGDPTAQIIDEYGGYHNSIEFLSKWERRDIDPEERRYMNDYGERDFCYLDFDGYVVVPSEFS